MLDAVVDYLPSPLDIPPTVANDPTDRRARDPRAQGRRALQRPRLQDHDRPLRRPARVHPRLLRHHEERATRSSTPRRATKERIGRLLKMHANKREEIKEVYAGDIAAAVGLKNVTTGDTICDPSEPVVLESINFPAPVIALAVEPKTKSRPGEARHRPGQADAGRPDLQGRDRQGHRPDQDLGHGRAAPRDHRGPPEARVRGRGQRGQAPGGLQGDDPQGRQGRGPVHQADRRPRASTGICKIEISPAPGEGFVFENDITGGIIPKEFIKPIEMGIREALERGILAGYPVVDVKVAPLRRQLPRRRLLGDGLQDRRLHGLPGRGQEGAARCCSSRS